MQTEDNMVRRTYAVTEAGANNLKRTAKALSISQFELAGILFELADANDPEVRQRAQEISRTRQDSRLEKKAMRAKLRDLSPEEIEAALKAIGKA